MVILVAGASGFLGAALSKALAARGHVIIGTARNPAALPPRAGVSRWVSADYGRDQSASDWLARLQGVDVAVNAVGIFRESGAETFESVHVLAPRALFAACAQARVGVVQISALGADADAQTSYHLSKRAADEFLLQIHPGGVVVQPSLVYGQGGASAASFNVLASLPLVPLPAGGTQEIQPIHLDDFVGAVTPLVEGARLDKARVPLVGREAVTLRRYLAALREAMGLGKASFFSVPWAVVAIVARICALSSRSLISTESISMLRRGNTADAALTTHLLGHAPRPVSDFIAREEAEAVRRKASAAWLLAMLRITIAIVWIASGVVSLGLYPVEASYQLLERVGISGALAPIVLYGAALLDIALGIASLLARWRWLWALQAAVIVAYMGLVTVALPEFWLHPFGPIVKNLPMLGVLWVLHESERR